MVAKQDSIASSQLVAAPSDFASSSIFNIKIHDFKTNIHSKIVQLCLEWSHQFRYTYNL